MSNKKELKGIVISNKMDKTVRVEVNSPIAHPVYKKVVNRRKVFFAHTQEGCNIGDEVLIRESKPYSKNVKWLVIKK